ncbi:hydrogenase maturation protease [Acidiphilium sp.]|uniref:hydrogenase maturation protease n=1 Tax=Acidiphilium sp. TaxID=527 RepID=UPI00258A8608|nr:hydrogenase maturation protease [Acidiphilium sp.]
MSASALVIGLGNPDRGDDALGLHVARRVAALCVPGVAVMEADGDMLALLDRWAGATHVLVVDAAAPITRPGRIHRFDPLFGPLPRDLALGSTHVFGLAEAVELARTLGLLPRRMTIYAVEAGGFEFGAALSPAVEAAVGPVAGRIAAELAEGRGDA